MDHVNLLRRHGLFDAKVPRYTSYPPANRFAPDVGAKMQRAWLGTVPPDKPISVYVHIPFCKRLCWFCACRTQGTKTLHPVASYVDHVLTEIDTIASTYLPRSLPMQRLHLGGGTPTLLSADLMTRLLERIESVFPRVAGFEFSVEIDPTEAKPDVLQTLANHDMTRASIGVQDFDPHVQAAIGRMQDFDLTRDVITRLRQNGVESLNIDLLYGLPMQSQRGLMRTLEQVVSLGPDRIALYGYAHVPQVSRRQIMIAADDLPSAEQRYEMSSMAKDWLIDLGYVQIGIDHFALPHDSLTMASQNGNLSRNFQGYTDDICQTLIGFGASAISRFRQGYLQNAVSTSAYNQRASTGGLAAHKGIVLSQDDQFIGGMIDDLMCNGRIDVRTVLAKQPQRRVALAAVLDNVMDAFPGALLRDADGVTLPAQLMPLARLIASHLDRARTKPGTHSLAV